MSNAAEKAAETAEAIQNNERLRAVSRFNAAADDRGAFGVELLFEKYQAVAAICSSQHVDVAPWSAVLDAVVAHRAAGGTHFDVMSVKG